MPNVDADADADTDAGGGGGGGGCACSVKLVPVCIRRHIYGVQWVRVPSTPTSHYTEISNRERALLLYWPAH